MPNDAKLGLVVGVLLVIAIGVLYFRKDPVAAPAVGGTEATAGQTTSATTRGQFRLTRTRNAVPGERGPADLLQFRRHVVAAGDTLPRLAEQYYGDSDKHTLIQRANPRLTDAAEPLTPGSTLVIPDLPAPPK